MAREEKNPNADRSDEVGYRNPPKHTRFKKGQSGNPKGRPRKEKKRDDQVSVAEVLNRPMKAMTKDGKTHEKSPFELGFRNLAKSALEKKISAIVEFLKICDYYGVLVVESEAAGGVVIVPKGISPNDWFRSQEDPSFKPVPVDYAALVKQNLPDQYPDYQKKMAAKRAEAEKLAEAEMRSKRRPRRSRLLAKRSGGRNKKTIVGEVAMELHQVTESGETRKAPLLELVLLTLRNMAAECRPERAFREYVRWEERTNPANLSSCGIMLAPAHVEPEEWVAKQIEKNKYRKPPPGIRDPNNDEKGRHDAEDK